MQLVLNIYSFAVIVDMKTKMACATVYKSGPGFRLGSAKIWNTFCTQTRCNTILLKTNLEQYFSVQNPLLLSLILNKERVQDQMKSCLLHAGENYCKHWIKLNSLPIFL